MFATETCARKKPEAAPENRVGDFFSISITRTGQNPFQTLEPHQAFSTMDTTTVSGVVYWLSKDPIRIAGGLNLYAFCDNNPVNFVDPMGLCGSKLKEFFKSIWLSLSGIFGTGYTAIETAGDLSTGTLQERQGIQNNIDRWNEANPGEPYPGDTGGYLNRNNPVEP